MEVNQKKYLEEKGFDVDGTMKRFLNNETLYLKCLKKFLDDSSFEKLKEGYEKGNCKFICHRNFSCLSLNFVDILHTFLLKDSQLSYRRLHITLLIVSFPVQGSCPEP